MMRTWKTEMVRTCREKDRARSSDENMEDGRGLTLKNRKIKTQRSYTKRHEKERSTERRSTRPENVANENAMHRLQIGKMLEKKNVSVVSVGPSPYMC